MNDTTETGTARYRTRTAEAETAAETEYGWDGIVVEYPKADQFRLPLVGRNGEDGVLVLDREYLLLLAAMLQDLLANDGAGRTANDA